MDVEGMGKPHLANHMPYQQIIPPPLQQIHREKERPAGTKGASVVRHNVNP